MLNDNFNQAKKIDDLVTSMVEMKYDINVIHSIEDMLCCGVKFKPFRFQMINNKPGVRWEMNEGYVSILFDTDKDRKWEIDMKIKNDTNDQCFPSAETTFHYYGNPIKQSLAFAGDNFNWIYIIPEIVEKHIKVKDTFNKTYSPIIETNKCKVINRINYYDGIINGFIEYNYKIYLVNLIEETEFERNRIYSIHDVDMFNKLKYVFLYKWLYKRLFSDKDKKDILRIKFIRKLMLKIYYELYSHGSVNHLKHNNIIGYVINIV